MNCLTLKTRVPIPTTAASIDVGNSSHYYKLPVKKQANQQVFVDIVNRILFAKKRDAYADTSSLEKKIDLLAYHLYELTYDEVLIIDPDTSITREEYEQDNILE